MSVTLDRLIAQHARDVPYAYTERDSMLYALAIGMGRDPLDEIELDFVYERRGRLRCVPTQAVTVARHNLIFEIGMRVEQFLHADQLLTLHRPLPTACEPRGASSPSCCARRSATASPMRRLLCCSA